MLLTYFST